MAEEDFFLNDRTSKIWNSSVESAEMSLYARKFRCVGVKQVGLKSFYIKAGKVTAIADSYASNPKSDRTDSSSCLFTLFFSPQFDRPSIGFAFPDSTNRNYMSGSSSSLPTKDSLRYGTQPNGSSYRTERLATIPEQTSIDRGKSKVFYLKATNSTNSTPPDKMPDLSGLTVTQIEDFSNSHQDIEFLAIELTWLE